MASETNLTLEGLYDILRNEKSHEELQELQSTFYLDVTSYLRSKKVLLESRADENELFANSDRRKLEYELRSIKRILKEIFEKREKKIIDIAMNKSRTRSDLIDTSSMLMEERLFYERIVKTFDSQRIGVLLQLFKGELPNVLDSKDGASIPLSSRMQETAKTTHSDPSFTQSPVKDQETKEVEKKSTEESSEYGNKVSVKFLHPVPRFIWKDMKEYGPFTKGEETELYKEIVDLLAKKGRAQMV